MDKGEKQAKECNISGIKGKEENTSTVCFKGTYFLDGEIIFWFIRLRFVWHNFYQISWFILKTRFFCQETNF